MKYISCIIPVFNLNSAGNWNRFCDLVKSLAIAAKPYLPEYFELIIVNDDPQCRRKEDIMTLIESFGLEQNLKLLSNEVNMGQAFSRNRGCEFASNEYLHFIDQDDYVNECFYSKLESGSGRDIYIANASFHVEKNHKEVTAISFLTRMLYSKAAFLKHLWPLLVSNIVYSPGQVIVKKELFFACGGFPVLENLGSDDYAFFLQSYIPL